MEKQDVATVLEFRTYLKVKRKTAFRLDSLVDYFFYTPFQTCKRSREELTKLIVDNFADVRKPLAYILPQKVQNEGETPSKAEFIFLEDQIIKLAKKPNVLNVSRLKRYFESELPVFYNKEYQKHELLTQPFALMGKITKLLDLVIKAVAKTPQALSLKDVAPKLELTEQFIQLVHLLPFIDPQTLISDPQKGQSFFVDLYNVMRIHGFVEYSKIAMLKDSDIIKQDSKVYTSFYYSVAGVNLNLVDLKYNLLKFKCGGRSDDQPRTNSWLFFCKSKSTTPKAFKALDYRQRLVCGRLGDNHIARMHAGVWLQPLVLQIEVSDERSTTQSPPFSVRIKNEYSLSNHRYSTCDDSFKRFENVSDTNKKNWHMPERELTKRDLPLTK